MGSRGLTKIQAVALVGLIMVAAVGGSAAYVLWSGSRQPAENIVMGICGDLDMPGGEAIWRGAVLAAEQINAQGGVLGRNITVIGEDDDAASADIAAGINALKLQIKLVNCAYRMGIWNLFTGFLSKNF